MTMVTENNLLRVPIFDGTEKSWLYWSETFLAILEQKDLSELVAHVYDDHETPQDQDDCERTQMGQPACKWIQTS